MLGFLECFCITSAVRENSVEFEAWIVLPMHCDQTCEKKFCFQCKSEIKVNAALLDHSADRTVDFGGNCSKIERIEMFF